MRGLGVAAAAATAAAAAAAFWDPALDHVRSAEQNFLIPRCITAPTRSFCGARSALHLRRCSVSSASDPVLPSDKDTGIGVTAASLNLAKNLVGSGILSLPAGIAAFSSSTQAVAPALLLLVASTLLSAYGFFLIGRVCEETGSSTFGGAWRGSLRRGAWVPQLVCVLECLGGSVVYAMVLGDVFSSLLQGSTLLPAAITARSSVITILAALVLYPLCCFRSFGQLAKFSLFGTLASCFVVFFVVMRFIDGSYAPFGAFYDRSAPAALQASSAGMINPRTLILVSILSTAYLVHFNAPQMYSELSPNRPGLQGKEKAAKQRRLLLVSLIGFGLAAGQYALVMVFGFLTFGAATQGNLLLNYSSSDNLAIAARVAVGLSTLFGYPMQFAGMREGILEAFKVQRLNTVKHRALTASLLVAVVFIACLLRDLGRFQAIEGALLAAFLIYIAPPLMAIRLPAGKLAKWRYTGIIIVGVAMSVVGFVVTLL